jgi:hypothetical protein
MNVPSRPALIITRPEDRTPAPAAHPALRVIRSGIADSKTEESK